MCNTLKSVGTGEEKKLNLTLKTVLKGDGITGHRRKSVHHEDLVPNEYISEIEAFYCTYINCFTDL